MSYLSLYRKYRPQRFEDVIGQEPVVRTLWNALERGRVAHAYMFSGPRGTGKTSLARLLAKGLNCRQGPTAEPCNVCSNCQRISDGYAMDVIEIDGASNRGIDEIRDLRENVRFAPTEGGYKVYIIDEVHMLTTDAFNALLKTLEEPPERVVFVLATTEPHKVPETIASRCQRFEFRNFTTGQLIARLEQVVEAEELDVAPAALKLIGRHAAGGMRDALALLDQSISFQSGRIEESHIAELLGVVPEEQLYELLNSIAGKERVAAITLVHEMIGSGADPAQLTKDCISLLRDLMLTKADDSEAVLMAENENWAHRWPQLASLELDGILTLIDVLSRAVADMRWMSPVWLPLEMAVVRSAGGNQEPNRQPANSQRDWVGQGELAQRLDRLEAAVRELQAGDKPSDTPVKSPNIPTSNMSASDQASTASDGRRSDTDRDFSPSNDRQAELRSLVSRWDEVSELLKQERQAPVEAFLREGRPWGIDQEGRLLLVFPRTKEFHKVSLEQPMNKEVLERVLAPLMGRAVEVLCYFEDEAPTSCAIAEKDITGSDSGENQPAAEMDNWAPAEDMSALGQQENAIPMSKQQESKVAGNPALEAAFRVFGGTVVELRDESGEGSEE
ncbi:MAG: DNA polymerase III subunit gamma/tau [Firmicutes bacterium]|nr:DNA polymerase III subunit gamma/tau [Bacillota bacterium]